MPSRPTDLIFTVLASVSAVLAAISLLDVGHVVALLQAAAPTAGVLVLLFAVVAVVRRRWWASLVATASSAALIVPAVSLPPEPVTPGDQHLSVLASNTFYGHVDAARLIEEVDARDVDVLVMPEMSDRFWQRLQDLGLLERLPYVMGRTGGGRGMIIATREPFTCVEVPSAGKCGVVLTGDDTLPWSVDAQGKPTFDQIVVDLADGTRLKGMHLWSPRVWPPGRWREQQGQMREWIEAQPTNRPLVLAGDFNAGPSHPVFRRYSAGLEDSPRGEFPWTATWPKFGPFGPLTHIDHVLARDWRVQDSETIAIPGSDHRAVWTLLTR
ncbi:MAG: endonuclease/exonuclease/phosphatase family protein [Mobilicoccus sp.]|nr:endonuclease/exonuclease/phosphatase family protein [Mobilicoccus sp.]